MKKRLCYADPPYPGTAARYYSDHPDYGGEVDHQALINTLVARYDGWALSTSDNALRDLLPLCPRAAKVAIWVKPNGPDPRTRGADRQWEPVIYVPARERKGAKVRNWFQGLPARGGGTLMGRKPLGFCMWLFKLLGAAPEDDFTDLFPGTGVVARCWGQFRRASLEYSTDTRAVSLVDERHPPPASLPAEGDTTIGERWRARS